MTKRHPPEVYKRYKITATHFRGDKRYGRTTTIVDKKTNKKEVFMGALTKGEAISQFWRRYGQPTEFGGKRRR
jgi:hypothetical protein